MIITINCEIDLPSVYLNKNIYTHLLNKIRSMYQNRCEQKYGYIKEIYDDFTIDNNRISTTEGNYVIYTVSFRAETIKPEIGDVYKGKIITVYSKAVIVEVVKNFKIVVAMINENTKLKVGDTVKVELVNRIFKNENFSCIGTLTK
jgi:DNA-directed RNA polymerase subunit E'/Rpb7